MGVINKSQLEQTLKNKNAILIDVLDIEFYNNEHIPGAINAPAQAVDFIEQVEALADRRQPLVLYSAEASCPAAPQAARRLAEEGFTQVSVYAGGLDDWKEQGGALASNIPGAVDALTSEGAANAR